MYYILLYNEIKSNSPSEGAFKNKEEINKTEPQLLDHYLTSI